MDKADDGITTRLSATERSSIFAARNLLPLLTVVALSVAAVRAVVPGWWTPLWLDETYTATIATQTSIAGLIDWCLHELSGPVYYTLTWIWAQAFGASNSALRMPSLICAVTTPALILWKGHPSRDVRMLWALLLATWLPGVTFPSEARPYALLMLLATSQAILFYRLIQDGGRNRALAWSSLTAVSVLTHYYMLPVSALQGLLYVVLRRQELRKTWPAALVFIPVCMWMAVHLPFVLSFTNPGVAWYPKLTLEHAWLVPFVLMGGNFAAGLLFIAMVPMLAIASIRGLLGKPTAPYSQADLATAGSAILAAITVVIIGFFKPTFLIRYFVPFMPGIMFGLALWTMAVARKYAMLPHAVALTAIIFGAGQLNEIIRHPELDIRNQFSFDGASEWLRTRGTRRFIFFWDNTTASISTPERLGEVGSYFLRSKGWQGQVIVPPIAGSNVNPNIVLTEIASRPGDGFLWAYDENYGGSLGRKHPSTLGQSESPFDCRDFGRKRIKIITCIRR